ncbi:MAG TPA: DUF6178 family protein [Polyangia bacterium]|nr:DUF6178 family protein [Polyangia bacterium]
MNDKLAVRSRKALARLLEQPRLVEKVQALPPRALLGLIDHVGLEDAGELVALATVEQLARIFDEDLWRSARAGEDERFDPARFGLWLEIMLEAGEAFAADRLAALPEDLLALALHAVVLVIDLDEVTLSVVDDQLEKALESGPYLDVGGYRVIARSWDGWDALGAALGALDEHHGEALRRLLERLFRTTTEWIADNGGLCNVFTSEELLHENAAADREDRRARAGHVSAASARAFLKLPQGDVAATLAEPRDAITRAYFREYRAPREPAAGERPASWFAEVTGEAGAARDGRPLLEGGAPAAEAIFQRTLAALDDDVAAERMRELAYLANVLVAAGRGQPRDAANEVLASCNAGLLRAIDATGRDAAELLAHTGCEKLFRLGR